MSDDKQSCMRTITDNMVPVFRPLNGKHGLVDKVSIAEIRDCITHAKKVIVKQLF